MNVGNLIKSKQIHWALNNGIKLVGSKGERGERAYTLTLEENLFEPISAETRAAFQAGDGNELGGKMRAVHSSSALGVNIFQYWQTIGQPEKIAQACRFCQSSTNISKSIRFEAKYPISDQFVMGPNIDVVIENEPSSKHKVYAVECKFTEAYNGYSHGGIKEKYLALDIWEDLPALHELSVRLSPDDHEHEYLHPAQLVKHILGLKRSYGKTGFRLLYLWYDALGYAGAKHRDEIDAFTEVARSDGIYFHALSYQELIFWMANKYWDEHSDYIAYLTGRYL